MGHCVSRDRRSASTEPGPDTMAVDEDGWVLVDTQTALEQRRRQQANDDVVVDPDGVELSTLTSSRSKTAWAGDAVVGDGSAATQRPKPVSSSLMHLPEELREDAAAAVVAVMDSGDPVPQAWLDRPVLLVTLDAVYGVLPPRTECKFAPESPYPKAVRALEAAVVLREERVRGAEQKRLAASKSTAVRRDGNSWPFAVFDDKHTFDPLWPTDAATVPGFCNSERRFSEDMLRAGTWWLPVSPQAVDGNQAAFVVTVERPREASPWWKYMPQTEFETKLPAIDQSRRWPHSPCVIVGLNRRMKRFFSTRPWRKWQQRSLAQEIAARPIAEAREPFMDTEVPPKGAWRRLACKAIAEDRTTKKQERTLKRRAALGAAWPPSEAQMEKRRRALAETFCTRYKRHVPPPPESFTVGDTLYVASRELAATWTIYRQREAEAHDALAKAGEPFAVYPVNWHWDASKLKPERPRAAARRKAHLDAWFAKPIRERSVLARRW